MKIKSNTAKEVGFEEKSKSEIERELLERHEEKNNPEPTAEELEAKRIEEERLEGETETKEIEIDDEKALSYLRKKFEREDITYDNILAEKVIEADLPEDLEALRRYKKETGRGIQDFVRLNRDIENEDPDKKIAEFIAFNNPGFDDDDIRFEMEREFAIDDIDDEYEQKAKRIAKKKKLAKADKFLTEQREKYRAPLESRDGFIPEGEVEEFQAYKNSKQAQNDLKEASRKKQEYFSAKTNELFSDNFEGFDFKVGEDNFKFKNATAEALKTTQSDAMNFIGKHLDENGMVKDAKAYHKALNAAMDPDALVEWAYQLGAANAIKKETLEAKNIDMKLKREGQQMNKKPKVREVNPDSGSSLRIKSRRKE